ncbi:MAG: hypothetical protein ABSH36_12035 [Solirubrobacteraceae bacterium]|jgi:hypothetical protein
MPPKDRARLQSDQQKIERTLERNQAALQTSRLKARKYARTLTNSGAEIRNARSDLRKAGYLK